MAAHPEWASKTPESASIDELRSALHESLDQRGVLGRIRAQRAAA